jgi:spoIIIJ-associated protein
MIQTPPRQENIMDTPALAEEKIADFLQTLTSTGGLNLKSKILACNGQVQTASSSPAGSTPSVAETTHTPELTVELSGPDTPLLLSRNGELLLAIEHIAAKILRLEPEEHDRISFDADNFKLLRNRELQLLAEAAIQKVRATGQPHAFPPMTSRERRIIHLALVESGLPSASTTDGPRRFVVLYPEGQKPEATPQRPSQDRTQAIRKSFRRR